MDKISNGWWNNRNDKISESKDTGTEIPNLTGKVHLLHCCIKYDGPSEVSHNFKTKPTGIELESGMKVEDAYFRGRKLQGATLPIPPGHSGSALGKKIVNKRTASDMSEQNSWEIKATFENVTYWNHDSLHKMMLLCVPFIGYL